MGLHNIGGSEAFDRNRRIYGVVRSYRDQYAWTRVIVPNLAAVLAFFFLALFLIATLA